MRDLMHILVLLATGYIRLIEIIKFSYKNEDKIL